MSCSPFYPLPLPDAEHLRRIADYTLSRGIRDYHSTLASLRRSDPWLERPDARAMENELRRLEAERQRRAASL